MEDKTLIGMLLFTATIFLFIGALIGIEIHRSDVKKEAIRLGIGKYVIVDPSTGSTEFKWISNDSSTNKHIYNK